MQVGLRLDLAGIPSQDFARVPRLTGRGSVRTEAGMELLASTQGRCSGAMPQLLPNEIQEGEDIIPAEPERNPRTSGAYGWIPAESLDSHGNRVKVGNFEPDGWNVNDNHPDWDRNDNLRACLEEVPSRHE